MVNSRNPRGLPQFVLLFIGVVCLERELILDALGKDAFGLKNLHDLIIAPSPKFFSLTLVDYDAAAFSC